MTQLKFDTRAWFLISKVSSLALLMKKTGVKRMMELEFDLYGVQRDYRR